jgi:hypothetical protein
MKALLSLGSKGIVAALPDLRCHHSYTVHFCLRIGVHSSKNIKFIK